MRLTVKFALAWTSVFLGVASFANVSLRNGNFYIGYVDVLYQGGFEPKIERVYNSKTPYNGIFGWGWGNEYEAFLRVSADGSVVVHEYGGGSENRFNAPGYGPKDLKAAVDSVLAAAKSTGLLSTADQIKTYTQKLNTDAVFRHDEFEKFVRQGKLKAKDIAEGQKLYSNRFSFQYIEKFKDQRGATAYRRVYDTGREDHFNSQGRLTRVMDRNKNFVEFTYGSDGRISKILDNQNRKMFFTFNRLGKVESIQTEGGAQSLYTYSPEGELVKSKDTAGNVYSYKYSADKRRNLVEIGYSNGKSMQISYYGRERNENVKSVRDVDGSLTEYTYGEAPGGSGKIVTVGMVVKNKAGNVIAQNKYEYNIGSRVDGEEWTKSMVAIEGSTRTETVYSENTGAPLLIKRGNEETRFEYDVKGRVTQKSTPVELTVLSYDPKAGKVSRVEKTPKKASGKKLWSEFKYDQRGNLAFARNSDGKAVNLFYDLQGRIKSMVDQRKNTLEFKYNEHNKPIEIARRSGGKNTLLEISYKPSGEVEQIRSKNAGRAVSSTDSEVSETLAAFQNLLEIIKPSGVTLSF